MANIQYYDVILKPVVTEKSMGLMADKKYTFLRAHRGYKEPDQRGRRKNVPGNKGKECKHHEPGWKEKKSTWKLPVRNNC